MLRLDDSVYLKFALTERLLTTVSVQVEAMPEQAPLQPTQGAPGVRRGGEGYDSACGEGRCSGIGCDRTLAVFRNADFVSGTRATTAAAGGCEGDLRGGLPTIRIPDS